MKWKRLLSLLLAAAMVMCLLPASVLADEPVTEWTEPSSETDAVLPDGESEPDTGTVNPVDPDPAPEPEAENAGGMVSLLAAHTHDITGAPGDAVWEPWDGTSDISKDGNYYLTDDATNSTSLTISGTVNLCLNGHTLTCTGGNQALEVKSGSLTICDCIGGGKVEFTKNSSNMQAIKVSSKYRSFTLYGGTIESSGANTRGVYTSGGDINICGGTVKSSASKGAVAGATGATVQISGGTVDGVVYLNTAKLYLSGTPSIGSVYLYDNPNTATGNQVYAADGGTPYTGGKIVLKTSEANPADGAVVVQDVSEENSGLFELDGYVLTWQDGDLVISSGQSVELTVTVPQGVRYGDTDVFVTAQTVPADATVTYARNQSTSVSCIGSIDTSTGELKNFTGGTFIVDVTASADGYNTVTQTVEIEIAARPITIRANDQTVAEGGAIQQGVEYVTVEGGLAEGDTLTGITLTQNGNAIVPSAAEFNDDAYYLNNIRYNITYANGAVTEPQPAHSHGTDGSAENPVDWIAWNGETALTEDGNYYLTASVERSETLEISGDVHLCLNGNTLTYTGTSYAIQVLADASLTICDCGTGGAVVGKSAVWTQGDLTLESGALRSTGTTYCVNIYNGSGESFFTMNGGSVEAAGIGVNMAKGSVMEMNGGSLTYGGNKGIYLYQGEALYVLGGSIAPNTSNTKSDAVGISVGGGYLSIEEDASITGIDYGVRLGSGDSNASATIRGSAAITATGGDAVGQMGKMTLYLMETPTLSGTNSDLYISGQNSTTYAELDAVSYRGNTLDVYYAGSSYENVPIIRSVYDASKFNLVYPENKYFSLGDDYCLYITDTPPVVGHVHPIADGMDALTWEPWDGQTTLSSGNYYLEDDFELTTSSIKITGAVSFCLNGHKLYTNAVKVTEVFNLSGSSAKLTICDCDEDESGEVAFERGNNSSCYGVKLLNGSTLNLYSGKITAAGSAQAVLNNKSKVNIYGGTVQANATELPNYNAYGAIKAMSGSTTTVTGGTILDKISLYDSAKLYLSGTPTIGAVAFDSNGSTYTQMIYAAVKDVPYTGNQISITTDEANPAAGKAIVSNVTEDNEDLFVLEGYVLTKSEDKLVIAENKEITMTVTVPETAYYGDTVQVQVEVTEPATGATVTFARGSETLPGCVGTVNETTGEVTGIVSGTFYVDVTVRADGYQTKTETVSFEIEPRPVTIKANDQTIEAGTDIATGVENVTATNLAPNDTLTGITLVREGNTITPSNAVINDDAAFTASHYTVSYETGTVTEATVHRHPIAEGMEELTWEPWDGTTNLTTAGNYYLEGNVELTKTIEVKAKVNLCLNGYTITDQEGKNLSYLFKVSSGKLTVCDCQGTGEIRMQRDSSNASAIGVLTSGSFDLYSGKISAAGNSRPVFSNNRPVNIYGGVVEGSGIYGALRADSASGVVTITGGEIKGAVMLYASSKLYLGGTPSIGSIALKSNSTTYSQKIYAATKDGLAYAGAPITITTAEKDIAANKVIVESVEESAKDLFTMEDQVLTYLADTKQLVISEAAQIDFDIILPEGKTYGDSDVYVSAETELEGVTFAYSLVRDLMSPNVLGTLDSATGQLTGFTSGRFDIQVTATKEGYSETTKTASFEIAKRGLTVTAKDQIRNDNTIDTGLDQVEVTGLAEGDELTGITLTLENGAIVPSEAKINGDEYVSYTNIRYEVTYVNGGLYKEQAALTITGLPAEVTYGDTFTLSTTGGSGSGAVTWTASGAATVNETTGVVTITGTDGFSITATKAAADGYTEAKAYCEGNAQARSLTITAKNQTIAEDGTIATGVDYVEVSGLAAGDSLTAITLTRNLDEDQQVDAIVPSAAQIGEKTACYDIAYVNGKVTLTQSISIDPFPQPLNYGRSFTATVSGGGSGAVTWSATGAAEVDAATGKVTLTDTGTFTLTATKAGDWHYAEATATEQGGAAKYELTVPEATFTYNGETTFQITLAGAFDEQVPVTIVTDSPNAGTYSNDKYEAVIDAAYQDHYKFMGMNDVVIEPIDVEDPDVVTVVVIVEPPKVVEAVVEVKPEVTVNGVVLVEGTDYEVSQVEVITAPTATQPGELSVQLRFMGNYTGTVVKKVPFDQGTPTMTLAPVGLNLRYTGTPQALVTAGKAENGTVVYSLSKEGPYSETIPTATEAGTYTVWYKVKGDLYFGDTEPASVTATIADNQSTVVTAPKAVQDLVYNSKAQTLVTAGTAENGTMVYSLSETGPYAEELPTAVHAGTYTVWYKVQGNAGYVDTQPVKLTVTIAQAPLTITVKDRYTYVGYKVPTAFDSDDYTVTGLYAGDKLSSIRLWVDTDGSAMVKNGYFVKSGKLPIKAAAVAPDYAITYRFGTLTVYRNAASNNGHYIYVEDTRHGDVEVDPTRAKAGETVTIRVYPDAGYELDELTVTDARGKDVTVSYKSSGVYTFVMPDYAVTVEATFRESGLPFIDVPGSAWYYDSVRYVYEQGLMDGVGNSRFAPNATTTRAMIVTILWRLEGEPQVNYAMQFEDVARNTWYTEAVRWAASEKIVEGYSAKAFGPNDPITREQMAAILYRYAQYCGYSVSAGNAVDLDSFRDGDAASAYAVPALCWAYAEGILEGRGDRMLVPTGTATRAEVAAILMRFNEDVLH